MLASSWKGLGATVRRYIVFEPREMIEKLSAGWSSLTAALSERSGGATHGWCPADSQVYNEAEAEKAWSRLLALYGKALA